MRKELVWVAVIGISFGLIIAFGVYRINASIKPNLPALQNSPKPKEAGSEFKIALNKPENGDVLTQDSVTVSGITKALAWITVSGESGDYIIQSDEKGLFSQEVKLTSGINQIKLTAFDPQGLKSIEKVLVIYSSAFQEKSFATPAPQTASGESGVRDKVAQKVAEALNKPKAFVGVVTDIADSTIQIKSLESEIKQISTADEAITVVNSKGTTSKIVKLTDIAIGDFIVAMGYVNSNSVLLAQRILITDPISEPKINASLGKVTETTKKVMTIASLKDSQNSEISPDSKTAFERLLSGKAERAKLTDVTQGDLIIYVSATGEDSDKIRSVFIVAHPQG